MFAYITDFFFKLGARKYIFVFCFARDCAWEAAGGFELTAN